MTKKWKKRFYRVLIGGALFFLTQILEKIMPQLSLNVILGLFLIAYFVTGGDVVKKAVGNIGRGRIFDENFLMTIATVGAFFVGDYPEAVAVMLFYQVGELFQSYAINKSRKSIVDLMDIRPDFAWVMQDGNWIKTKPEEVKPGDMIFIKPGERIPLDGTIKKGNTTLDTKALTGESVPREALIGENVISGCINITGAIEVEVTKGFGESTVAKILDLVENATGKKAEAENFISRFAKYYTPIVVGCAFLLAITPPLLLGGEWQVWIYRALTFLVISCPCALVISIPLSFFGGLGGASKMGVLVKGSNYLEALAKTEVVVMDKTGTLTKGSFELVQLIPNGISESDLLEMTAYAESRSSHPISISLQEAYGKEIKEERLSSMEEVPGYGVKAVVDGCVILAGNEKLMNMYGIQNEIVPEIGTVVYVAKDGIYQGCLLIADEVKADSAAAIQSLEAVGIKKIVMLTGDRKEAADYIAKKIGITEVKSQLLPIDKVTEMEKLLQEKSQNGKLVFVGDGINDAPVLARADIGIAMGGLGSDAAIEAADIVIMTDEPSKIAKVIRLSQKTLVIVKQNIVFAMAVKIIVLLLSAAGYASMWAAIFADVGVAVLAILNAMRVMMVKKFD